jgi:Lon protease-like protein
MAAAGPSLPRHLPIFPLRGALLLPGGKLPLNIFEPRYLAMVRDALQSERCIGMIQPLQEETGPAPPELYRTGCLGRLERFRETADGRILILLNGVCRFDVVEELATTTPYRQVVADYGRWLGDFTPDEPPEALRGQLLLLLSHYLERVQVQDALEQLKRAPLAALVTSLAMALPFSPEEKQALLEAPDLKRQTELLIALLEFALYDEQGLGRPN